MTMGFVLLGAEGGPSCLEGFQNCDPEGRAVDLRGHDLHAL
jgi:hypothetical protein